MNGRTRRRRYCGKVPEAATERDAGRAPRSGRHGEPGPVTVGMLRRTLALRFAATDIAGGFSRRISHREFHDWHSAMPSNPAPSFQTLVHDCRLCIDGVPSTLYATVVAHSRLLSSSVRHVDAPAIPLLHQGSTSAADAVEFGCEEGLPYWRGTGTVNGRACEFVLFCSKSSDGEWPLIGRTTDAPRAWERSVLSEISPRSCDPLYLVFPQVAFSELTEAGVLRIDVTE